MNFEAGLYHAILKNIEIGTTGSKDTECMALTWNITAELDADGRRNAIEPCERTTYWYLSDAAWKMTERKLQENGYNNDWNNPELNAALYSEGATLECQTEIYEGKQHEKWDFPFKKTLKGAVSVQRLRELQARYKMAAAPLPGAPPARAAALRDLNAAMEKYAVTKEAASVVARELFNVGSTKDLDAAQIERLTAAIIVKADVSAQAATPQPEANAGGTATEDSCPF